MGRDLTSIRMTKEQKKYFDEMDRKSLKALMDSINSLPGIKPRKKENEVLKHE